MTTDKTPDHTERYEWLGNANEWKPCTHEEAIKLSKAKYEVREIWPFAHCTCPSGDGSLRHPCPSHPATLATVKHGGCVQLPTSDRERFEVGAEGNNYEIEWTGLRYVEEATHDAWLAWQAALDARPENVAADTYWSLADMIEPHVCREGINPDGGLPASVYESVEMLLEHWLSAQPSPGGQGARRCAEHCQNGRADVCLASQSDGVICPEDSCDIDDGIRHNHLAARQPVGEPVGEAWIVVKEHVWDHGDGGRPTLAYLWPSEFERRVYPSFAAASEFIKAGDWPLGFVAMQIEAPPAQAVDLGPVVIPDTLEVRDILGRPNFWCSPWANVLRMRGDVIPHKAEEEQAAVIRFMLNHYLAHGAAWAETAGAELDAIRKADSQAVGK